MFEEKVVPAGHHFATKRYSVPQGDGTPRVLVAPMDNRLIVFPIAIEFLEKSGNPFHSPKRPIFQISFNERMQDFVSECAQARIFVGGE